MGRTIRRRRLPQQALAPKAAITWIVKDPTMATKTIVSPASFMWRGFDAGSAVANAAIAQFSWNAISAGHSQSASPSPAQYGMSVRAAVPDREVSPAAVAMPWVAKDGGHFQTASPSPAQFVWSGVDGVGIASSFNPSSLSLTAWIRNFSVVPWLGDASAGISGAGNSDAVHSSADPTVGTALNGHGVAAFNGTSQFLDFEGTLDRYANSGTFSGWALVKPTSANRLLLVDDNSAVYIGFGTDGIFPTSFQFGVAGDLGGNDSNGGYSSWRTYTTNVWQLVTFRLNGTSLQVGINEAPGASGGNSTHTFSTVSLTPRTSTLHLGSTGVLGSLFVGSVAEIGLSDVALTDANFTNIKTYINTQYALSL